jgi:hypothetical protein
MGVEGGMNLYGYGHGNPVNLTDRSGLDPDAGFCYPYDCRGGGGGGAGGSSGFYTGAPGQSGEIDLGAVWEGIKSVGRTIASWFTTGEGPSYTYDHREWFYDRHGYYPGETTRTEQGLGQPAAPGVPTAGGDDGGGGAGTPPNVPNPPGTPPPNPPQSRPNGPSVRISSVWNELVRPYDWYDSAIFETTAIFPDDDYRRHCYYACVSQRRFAGPLHVGGWPSDWLWVEAVRKPVQMLAGRDARDAWGDFKADLYGTAYSLRIWQTCEEQCDGCPVRR